jgi:preprotein translocase subunit SecF
MSLEFLEKHWKQLMWITIIFLIFSIGLIAYNIATTGSFMKRDTDLSGGKVITVEVYDVDLPGLKLAMPYADIRIVSGVTKTLMIEIPFEKNETDAIKDLKASTNFLGEPSLRIVGPSLGNLFFQQAQIALVMAFILMAITVFVLFRSIAPSSIVLLAVFTDILGTIAVLIIIDMPLSLPVIGALLALIGYSVGTDILLTAELLKSKRHDYKESIIRAAKTGMTLNSAALIALASMLLVSGSDVIGQIAIVMMIGLIIDVPATWLTNAGVLRRWMERKKVAS